MKRFHEHFRGTIAGSEHDLQFGREENDESQAEGVVQNIEPGQEYAGNLFCADLKEEVKAIKQGMTEEVKVIKQEVTQEIKAIKQEMTEMKARIDRNTNVMLQIKEMLLDGRKHYVLP